MRPSVSPGDTNGESAGLLEESYCDDVFAIGVEQDGATLRLRLTGEFAWPRVGHVEAALERVSEGDIRCVVFDLRELEFIDSAGLRTILRANERAGHEPFDVVVVRPLGLANRVFTLTRASRELKLVYADEGD